MVQVSALCITVKNDHDIVSVAVGITKTFELFGILLVTQVQGYKSFLYNKRPLLVYSPRTNKMVSHSGTSFLFSSSHCFVL